MCNVETLNEQRELWPHVRNILLSWPLHKVVVSTEWWAWKAAGVPPAQRKMFVDDFADRTGRLNDGKHLRAKPSWQYVVDTLDPAVETTQLSRDNYFYYLCLQGRYSRK